MKRVYFVNDEPIDLDCIRLMGVSVKTGENPIGFFGTGLKYAIAVLLRHGAKVSLRRNRPTPDVEWDSYEFGLRERIVRGETFHEITINGEGLGVTTQLGKAWEMWQAFRELYSNMKDENGIVTDREQINLLMNSGTVFIVESDQFHQCYVNRNEIFLEGGKPFSDDSFVEAFSGDSENIYFRGVKAFNPPKRSIITWNIKAALDLTEDRTIRCPHMIDYWIADYIAERAPEELVERVIMAPEGTFEHRLRFNATSNPSEVFMKVCHRHRYDGAANGAALALFRQHSNKITSFETAELTNEMRRKLVQATLLVKRLVPDFTLKKVRIVKGLGEEVYGRVVDDMLLVDERCFDHGKTFVASTLYEEWIHKHKGLHDETRCLQNFLFEKLFSTVDELVELERISECVDGSLRDVIEAESSPQFEEIRPNVPGNQEGWMSI